MKAWRSSSLSMLDRWHGGFGATRAATGVAGIVEIFKMPRCIDWRLVLTGLSPHWLVAAEIKLSAHVLI